MSSPNGRGADEHSIGRFRRPFLRNLLITTTVLAVAVLGMGSSIQAKDQNDAEPQTGSRQAAPVLVLPPVTPKESPPIWPGVDPDIVPIEGAPREGTSAIGPSTLDETEEDPAVQLEPSDDRAGLTQLSPPIENFLGQGGSNPNDTVGDVGFDHFVQAINSGFQVFDKVGNSLDGPFLLSSLWRSPDGVRDEACEFDRGDPVVLYDNLADRWLLAQFQPKSGEIGGEFSNFVCIAISQTPDPTRVAGYNLYAFDLGEFPDYFKIGAWTDGYYLSANGGQVPVWVFDRLNMLNGNPAGAIKLADVPNLPQSSFGLLMPADIDGLTAPPAGSPSYLYRQVDGDANGGGGDRIELYTAVVNWADPGSSVLNGPTNIPLVAFNSSLCGFLSFGCAPQPGTASVLDPVNEVGMFRFPYRNYGSREVLAGNFAVDVNNADGHGIRWFVLERSGGPWTVANQGTYAPQPVDAPAFVHRFMGSIAMDRKGNLALAYTTTSAEEIFPSARYTGRSASDPLGLLPATEQTLREGQASLTAANNLARWGDYYALVVDPVDDCTFWYTGDFGATGPTRQSVIGSFKFSDCETDLSVTKSAAPDPATAGRQITYTINVLNDGALDASNVTVTDTLPDGFFYVADSLPGAECADKTEPTITCNVGDLGAGASTSFTITALIDSAILLIPDGPATSDNLVEVEADQADGNLDNNSFTLSTLVNESADLQVEKICKPDGEAHVVDGTSNPAPAKCEIHVTNNGPSAARNATLMDEIFASGQFSKNYFADPGVTCTPQAPNDYYCDLGDIDAGATVVVTVLYWASEPVDINDLATVDSDTPDPNPDNNSAVGSVTFIDDADLAVTKDCKPDEGLLAGETGTCTIIVQNFGPVDAKNVHVVDTHISNLPFTIDGVDPAGQCVIADNVVTCDFASIAAGATETIVVSISEPEPMDINDTVTVTSANFDPDTSNNEASDGLHIVGVADLRLRKEDLTAEPIYAGNELLYRLVVTNLGPSEAKGVVVTDMVPAGTTMDAVVVVGAGSCAIGVAGDSARPTICNLGNIPSGEQKVVRILVTVLPDTRGVLHNDAEVTSETYDNNNSNNRATEDTTIAVKTDLELKKIGDKDPVAAGDKLTYLIELTNKQGPSTATNVILTDNMDPRTSLESYKVLKGDPRDCIQSASDPDVLICEIDSLAPGELLRLVITVLVDPSVPDGETLTNCVSATADDLQAPVVNPVCEDTLVRAVADLWVDKTGGFITQNPGKNVRYTITVHNDEGCSGDDPQICGEGGPSDALDVTIIDRLPSTAKKLVVTFVTEDCDYDPATHLVTCITPLLAAGDTVVHEIEATPRGKLGVLENYVDVSSTTFDPDTGNNTDRFDLSVGGGGQKGTGE